MASVDAEPTTSRGSGPGAASDTQRRAIGTISAVAVLAVVVDQLTKWWALETLTDPTRTIDLFWTLRLKVLYNTGTAFSLTTDSGPVVTVIAVIVIVVLVRSGRHQRHGGILACYGLVLGGTVGNVLDRIFRDGDGVLGGPVIDFVDLQWFPVFNVADAALVVGIILLLVLGTFTDAFVDGDGDRDDDAVDVAGPAPDGAP